MHALLLGFRCGSLPTVAGSLILQSCSDSCEELWSERNLGLFFLLIESHCSSLLRQASKVQNFPISLSHGLNPCHRTELNFQLLASV